MRSAANLLGPSARPLAEAAAISTCAARAHDDTLPRRYDLFEPLVLVSWGRGSR